MKKKKAIGLIVNPVAGMGGSVGLKGTDGDMFKKALELGANPVTPLTTGEFVKRIKDKQRMVFYTAPGKMGEDYIKAPGVESEVVGSTGENTTAEDSRKIAREMVKKGIDLLIFVGGDGTARDIYDAVGTKVPVVGVPSGVKVFSSVFAVSARAAAEMIDEFMRGTDFTEQEVLDIDEDNFRKGKLASRLYGYLLVPEVKQLLQEGKQASSTSTSTVENKKEVARYIVENLDGNTLYLMGPGTTVKAVTDELNVEKTLLGIDALFNGELVDSDINEKAILKLLESYRERKIIITPLGGNGFIFGRGSRQFTPEVISKIGRENIVVIGTRDKVNGFDCLRVDTGDYQLDEILSGYIKVIVGYNEEILMEVRS